MTNSPVVLLREFEYAVWVIDNYRSFKNNATQMLDALLENPQPDIETALENLFGYLFAKAMEMEINEQSSNTDSSTKLVASFSPSDAFEGKLHSTLESKRHEMLLLKMELGRQFYKDYKMYTIMRDLSEDDFEETITLALVAVQRIGQLHAIDYMDL